MSTMGAIALVAVAAVAAMAWFYLRNQATHQLQEILNRRKSSSKVATLADYVEGMEHIPLVVALSESTFFYENRDLQAEIELSRVDEVEFDDELSTGKDVAHGKVMRLRSHGRVFEFILDPAGASEWAQRLPSHRMGEPGAVHAG
ncbi:MAG TPA: hypothetical protein VNM92_03495 [Thermoanaerobaculia bacterium]|nr:hypothetical protein [Thermoanaerobaculia bacterium]